MPEAFKVPGVAAKDPPQPDSRVRELIPIRTKAFVEVRPPVRGAAEFETLRDVAADDLIELEFDGGIRQWIRADQLREDLQRGGISRAAADGTIEIPSSLPTAGMTRGESTSLPLRFFKQHAIDIGEVIRDVKEQLLEAGKEEAFQKLLEPGAEAAAEIVTPYILWWLERKLKPHAGLYYLDEPRKFGAEITKENAFPASAEPILLFIHGTASNTEGSFGGLSGTRAWKTLQEDKYKGRILALEHCTLSVSPIQNAIDAARLLPREARLHLVTHSRGGLVGELLSMRPLEEADLQPLVKDRPEDVRLLKELSEVLKEREFNVERFVRVACPARGTLLASDRLDRYLSVVLSLVGKIPAVAATAAYPIFEACVAAIVKMRAKPEAVPGIEAMRPESPIIHFLNRADFKSKADLAIIAGRAEIGGLLRSLGFFAATVFYRTANDFVVNTESMYGGMSRQSEPYFFKDEGGTVDHFHYFANEVTREQMLAWLVAGNKAGGAFAKLRYLDRGLIFPGLRGDTKRPLLIFVPGLFGTHLGDGTKRLWLNPEELAPGKLADLKSAAATPDPDKPEKPDDPPDAGKGVFLHRHQPLLEYLANSYEVMPFPYDWRRSPEEFAGTLAELVQKELAKTPDRVVRFFAIGSGGHIIRAMAEQQPEWWKSLTQRSGRAVVLGSFRDSAATAQAMSSGKHKLIRLLDMVDRGASGDLGQLFGSFPSIAFLAGSAAATAPEGFAFVRGPGAEGEGEQRVDPNVWYAPVPLGNIGEHWPSFEGMRELLAAGGTDRLSKRPAVTAPDGQSDSAVPLLYPRALDVADTAFEADEMPAESPITVSLSVTHGHLRGAQYPVLVGHYVDDAIVSAEAVLDRELDGTISRRFHMDLYPGASGTAEVVSLPQCAPPGALIIGLGEVGEIKPETVRRGVTMVALKYASQELERANQRSEPLLLGITSLLVGTYGGNGLSVRDAIKAVVDGVVQANQTLRSRKLADRVRITQIEFVDLYLDQAIAAAHEICDLVKLRHNDPTEAVRFEAKSSLNVAEGGQFRRPVNPYSSGWWRRIRIEQTGEAMKYTVLTERARVNVDTQATQKPLIEYYLRSYGNSTEYVKELSMVLFESLIPEDLKDYIRDHTSLVLIVDLNTAAYPWELLAVRSRKDVEPLSTKIGLLRQFAADAPPPRARNTQMMMALVIGDPGDANDPKMRDPNYPPLDRARDEATLVARVFEEGGYSTKPLIRGDATPLAIHAGIVARENRIIHIAGHGHYEAGHPESCGFVIGPGLYFTASEVGSVDPLPEFVFLNCCDLGRMATPEEAPRIRSKLAGTLAQTLIEKGVKAVIAAGWAVNDAAALTFARTFYEEMIKNRKRFGEAVREARSRTFEQHPGSNTFAAYQCYGNPDFALSIPDTENTGTDGLMVAREEYLDYARNMEARARGAEAGEIAAMVEDLRKTATSLPGFAKDGEVLSAIASAYGALGAFPLAIETYRKALNDPNAKVLLRAAEQLANLEYRYAAELSGSARDELVQNADKHLEWLRGVGATTERLSLFGSAFKKMAGWSEGETRTKNLREALAHYCLAYTDGSVKYYPALNAVALALLLPDFNQAKALETILKAEENAREELVKSDTLWNRVAIPDARMLKLIIEDKLKDEAAQNNLILEYRRAMRGATRQERSSVGGQVEFLHRMLEPGQYEETIRALSRLMRELGF